MAVAALLSYNCPQGPPQMQAAFDAFTNATELRQPESALRWVLGWGGSHISIGGREQGLQRGSAAALAPQSCPLTWALTTVPQGG